MVWTAYRLVYQAKSPVHIGWHTLGYIKLTRYYVTGKSMWGAATANLTRASGKPHTSEYKRIGDQLKKSVLFSYFYPALNSNSPLLPEFTDKGMQYGYLLESEFERLFIRSFGQTAVTPDTNTAEDETLHESEFIAPMIYNEDKKMQEPVYFVGYIFVSDDAEYKWATIKDAIKEIFVGGDRKYGWGRLVLDMKETTDGPVDTVFENELSLNGGELEITLQGNKPIPAHLPIDAAIKVKGNIEPLVGLDWNDKGAGQSVEIGEKKVYWVPGSVLMEQAVFNICGYGILNRRDNNV